MKNEDETTLHSDITRGSQVFFYGDGNSMHAFLFSPNLCWCRNRHACALHPSSHTQIFSWVWLQVSSSLFSLLPRFHGSKGLMKGRSIYIHFDRLTYIYFISILVFSNESLTMPKMLSEMFVFHFQLIHNLLIHLSDRQDDTKMV